MSCDNCNCIYCKAGRLPAITPEQEKAWTTAANFISDKYPQPMTLAIFVALMVRDLKISATEYPVVRLQIIRMMKANKSYTIVCGQRGGLLRWKHDQNQA